MLTFGILVYQAIWVEPPREFKHIAWGFLVIGISFILPRFLAVRQWSQVEARIVTIKESDEMQDLRFTYEVNGEAFHGRHHETGLKKVGDPIIILVDPKRPENHIVQTPGVNLLGIAFIVVAILTLLMI